MANLNVAHIPFTGEKKEDPFKAAAVHYPPKPRNDERRIRLPPIPDLRFEQAFLATLKPFIHPKNGPAKETEGQEESLGQVQAERGALASTVDFDYGVPLHIQWGAIIWLTMRDQIFTPFLTGTGWNLVSILTRPLITKVQKGVATIFSVPFPSVKGAAHNAGSGVKANVALRQ